jgi:hypothetical protein
MGTLVLRVQLTSRGHGPVLFCRLGNQEAFDSIASMRNPVAREQQILGLSRGGFLSDADPLSLDGPPAMAVRAVPDLSRSQGQVVGSMA